VKRDLFRVLGCDDIGMSLTESLAMLPAASVSGFLFAHPDATYFNVGKIGADQVQDWARRSDISERDAERALTTLL
jgi:5-methyltetrahydrofolate--homocysteine methyltransferase